TGGHIGAHALAVADPARAAVAAGGGVRAVRSGGDVRAGADAVAGTAGAAVHARGADRHVRAGTEAVLGVAGVGGVADRPGVLGGGVAVPGGGQPTGWRGVDQRL